MNREIKFRAKNVCGHKEFVYGYFCKDAAGTSYITTINGEDTYYVDDNTLGQFTGLTDKNGKEIYEGDIVKTGNGREWEVRFGEYTYYDNHPAYGFFLYSALSVYPLAILANVEIIGNIHQHPHLLTDNK